MAGGFVSNIADIVRVGQVGAPEVARLVRSGTYGATTKSRVAALAPSIRISTR